MKRAEFDATVRRLERYATENPAAYHRRVALLGVLGYAYVCLVLGGLAALLVVLVMNVHVSAAAIGKLVLIVGALIVLVLRALWVRLDPPGGIELDRTRVPELFALVDSVVERTGAPAPHAVLLTDDFNAAIVQLPRFGFFGGHRNYLIVGLPLLQGVTAREFEAILAHECGHLAGGHGKSGAWIYRLRAGWSQLVAALEAEAHWGRFLFLRFFQWYAPQFAAYSFVAAREQEYAADATAARVTSPALAGQALVRISLAARELGDRFWPSLYEDVKRSPTPTVRPYSQIATALKRGFVADDGRRWLGEALAERTGTADTHPSLRDRLQALGAAADAPPPLVETAADRLLGAAYPELLTELDDAWQRGVRDNWAEDHERHKADVARHAELLAQLTAGTLARDDRLQLAMLEERVGDSTRARQLYEALLRERPQDADLCFAVGRLRLDANDDSGVELLRRAVELDPDWTPTVTSLLAPRLEREGADGELHALLDRYDEFADAERRDSLSAARIERRDRFEARDTDPKARREVAALLAARTDVRRAWLVTKLRPDGRPLVALLVVERRIPWWKFESSGREAAAEELANAVAAFGLAVFVPGSEERWLVRRLKKLDGALVYEAGGR